MWYLDNFYSQHQHFTSLDLILSACDVKIVNNLAISINFVKKLKGH